MWFTRFIEKQEPLLGERKLRGEAEKVDSQIHRPGFILSVGGVCVGQGRGDDKKSMVSVCPTCCSQCFRSKRRRWPREMAILWAKEMDFLSTQVHIPGLLHEIKFPLSLE